MKRTYISLLRGINVSGHHLIKMELLRKTCGRVGLEDTITYLQSGNLVFKTEIEDCDTIAQTISAGIASDFGFTIPVMVFEASQWKTFIEENPMLQEKDADPAFMHLTLLSDVPQEFDIHILSAKKLAEEKITLSGRVVYLYCPQGYGNTKLSNTFIESRLKLTATTRNLKTCRELMRISQDL